MCDYYKWGGAVLALLVILFSFWQTAYSKWVIVVIAVIWFFHAVGCNDCCKVSEKPKAKPRKKKK